MANPFSTFWQMFTAQFNTSSPGSGNTNNPGYQGPFTNQYSSYQPMIGRTGVTANRGWGSGQTGTPVNRQNGFWPNGYVSEGDYQPTGHGMAPIDNLNHLIQIPAFSGYATDGRSLLTGTVPAQQVADAPKRGLYAQPQFTQDRSVSMWGVLEFPAGWRTLVSPQLPARYNLYNSIQLARPILGEDALIGYAIPSGQAGGYPTSGYGRG